MVYEHRSRKFVFFLEKTCLFSCVMVLGGNIVDLITFDHHELH